MSSESERRLVRLVVYIFLEKDGKVLLGKRKNSFGAGHYSTPAGHIDHAESVMGCAKRELFEETGIDCDEFEFLGVKLMESYEINGEKAKEYVAFAVRPKTMGEPKLMEPEKCEAWEWHSMDNLPEPMFPPVPILIEFLRNPIHFID